MHMRFGRADRDPEASPSDARCTPRQATRSRIAEASHSTRSFAPSHKAREAHRAYDACYEVCPIASSLDLRPLEALAFLRQNPSPFVQCRFAGLITPAANSESCRRTFVLRVEAE